MDEPINSPEETINSSANTTDSPQGTGEDMITTPTPQPDGLFPTAHRELQDALARIDVER